MTIRLEQTNSPSPHVRQRSKRMWVKSLAPNVYAIKPKEKGKVRRVVTFIRTASGIRIDCRDFYSGESCPANAFKRPCAHVEAAIKRLLVNNKRRENREAKSR